MAAQRPPKRMSGGSSETPSTEPEDIATLEQRRRKHRLDGLKIVVVEDTTDARRLIERHLSNAGAEVYPAASAKAARELLAVIRPDVIVSDIGMPEEDGLSFIRELRASERYSGRHIPAIALTAFVGLEHRDLTIRAGFEEHLCKPVASETLIDAILRVMLSGDISLH